MVFVTGLNGTSFAINGELIEHAEATPDTVITLTTGNKFVVKETLAELAEKVLVFRHAVMTGVFPAATEPRGEEIISHA